MRRVTPGNAFANPDSQWLHAWFGAEGMQRLRFLHLFTRTLLFKYNFGLPCNVEYARKFFLAQTQPTLTLQSFYCA